jgi:hypothetical protein
LAAIEKTFSKKIFVKHLRWFFFFALLFSFVQAERSASFFPPKAYTPKEEWLPFSVEEGIGKLQGKQWQQYTEKQQMRAFVFWGGVSLAGGGIFLFTASYFFPWEKWKSWRTKRRKKRKEEQLLHLMRAFKDTSSSLATEEYLWKARALFQQWFCFRLGLARYALVPAESIDLAKKNLTQEEYALAVALLAEIEPCLFSEKKEFSEKMRRQIHFLWQQFLNSFL